MHQTAKHLRVYFLIIFLHRYSYKNVQENMIREKLEGRYLIIGRKASFYVLRGRKIVPLGRTRRDFWTIPCVL